METLKIKSTHPESQGEFVIINAEDFNAESHKLYEPQDLNEELQKPAKPGKK